MVGKKIMEKAPSRRINGMKLLSALASIVIIIGGLKLAADLLLPVILAFFLAVVCPSCSYGPRVQLVFYSAT